jgi:hypothetical protein
MFEVGGQVVEKQDAEEGRGRTALGNANGELDA